MKKQKFLLDGRENEKERLFKSQLRVLSQFETLPANKKIIKNFIRDKQLVGVSNRSITPYLAAVIRLLSKVNKNLRKITAEETKDYFANMQNSNSERDKPYAGATISNHMRHIKFFFKWLNNGDYPKCVDWIKENGKAGTKLPDDMLTEEEIEELIRGADNTRDQAIISTLYSSAARAGEFCNVRIKDVKFDKLGAIMRVNGKTGPRPIRLIECVPYLQAWMQVHPFRDDDEAFLWYNVMSHKWAEVNRQTLSRIIGRAQKRAKLKKRIHPHLFRHSKLTALAPKVTEQVLKAFAGWSPDSRMAAVYIHMSGKALDMALVKAHGLSVEEEVEESRLLPKVCPRCKTKNPGVAKFCSTCSMALTLNAALELDEFRKKDDKTVKAMMERMALMQQSMKDMFSELSQLKEAPTAEPREGR